MHLEPAEYLEAAKMRVNSAHKLWIEGRYAASLYFSGVATECVLRAYIMRYNRDIGNPVFDKKHSLQKMLKERGVEVLRDGQFSTWVGEVSTRWRNSYRYASDTRVGKDLKGRELFHRLKGNALKQNARLCFDSASYIVGQGTQKWEAQK